MTEDYLILVGGLSNKPLFSLYQLSTNSYLWSYNYDNYGTMTATVYNYKPLTFSDSTNIYFYSCSCAAEMTSTLAINTMKRISMTRVDMDLAYAIQAANSYYVNMDLNLNVQCLDSFVSDKDLVYTLMYDSGNTILKIVWFRISSNQFNIQDLHTNFPTLAVKDSFFKDLTFGIYLGQQQDYQGTAGASDYSYIISIFSSNRETWITNAAFSTLYTLASDDIFIVGN